MTTSPAPAAGLCHGVARRVIVVLLVAACAVVQPGPATPASAAPACRTATYAVVRGDSWSGIAYRHRVTLAALLAENTSTATTPIYPGQSLCLPANAVLGAPAPTTTAPTPTTAPATTPTVAPTTTAVQQVIPLAQFPVQGQCWFANTWGAPRSGGRTHEGVDIIAKSGQFVYAVRDGVLNRRYVDTPGALAGNGWRLTAADGTYFFYAHLSGFAPGLSVGSSVTAGQIIGFVGSTGSSSTPHLHFEIHPGGGAAIDPTPSVKAVDGCKVSAVPAQPNGAQPPTPPVTTTPPPATTPPPGTAAPPGATTPATTVPPAATPGTHNGLWQFVSPAKVFDGALTAGTASKVQVVGAPGVPADTPAVMVRLTARDVPGNGYITVHTCDQPVPTTASLVVRPGMLNAGTAIVTLGGGRLCVVASRNLSARIDVIAVGMTGSKPGVGAEPIVARRALDTRTSGRPAAGRSTPLSLAALGAAKGSAAVTLTVTVVSPSAAGALRLGPCGGSPWSIDVPAAVVQSFSMTIRINDSGLCVSSTMATDVVVDVNAVWRGTQAIKAVAPGRALDTRITGQVGPAAQTVVLPGAPAKGAALLTLTLIGGDTGSAVFAWPCAAAQPAAAVLATPAKVTTSVNALVAVGGGAVCVAATSPSHLVVDVVAAG